ncbi:site-specific integrase [Actinomycetes bacterium NPDC127524]
MYIQIEKNYSDHTVTSYEYDLVQFLSFYKNSIVQRIWNPLQRPMPAVLFSIKWELAVKSLVP